MVVSLKEKNNISVECKNKLGSINPIVPGCNYHTSWQSAKSMRFVLVGVSNNGNATLKTRTTNKQFTTPISSLIFIKTRHNLGKALKLAGVKPIK